MGVLLDARIAADLLGPLRVMQQVGIVPLLPDEDQMRGGHEDRHERAARRGTRERVRPDAEPATVIGAVFASPEFLFPGELLLGQSRSARFDPALLHREKATRHGGSSSGTLGPGPGSLVRSRSRVGRGARLVRAPTRALNRQGRLFRL